MGEKNIPINKGNYSMETQEREQLFEKYRGEGWEEEYKAYRDNWTRCPKEQKVLEYPILVDIELSSLCNLKCPMCYTITDEFKKKVNAKLMDEALFKKIIDEIGGKVPAIRLSLRGEPTLHPKFIEFIKYSKEHGIKEVSFLTNGSKFDEEYFKQVMLAGADWITISIDGTDEMYESIRKPLKFEDTLNKIKMIKRVKEEYKCHRPVIKVQSIWPALRENPDKYYKAFKPYVDLIAFNPLIDYLDNDEDIIYEEDFVCPQPYQRLVIGADGQVLLCSNDEDNLNVLGNINEQSIYEVWHSEELEKIRKMHKEQDGFMHLPVCKKCYLPRKVEENEVGIVEGREFKIKNYINREQVIGK